MRAAQVKGSPGTWREVLNVKKVRLELNLNSEVEQVVLVLLLENSRYLTVTLIERRSAGRFGPCFDGGSQQIEHEHDDEHDSLTSESGLRKVGPDLRAGRSYGANPWAETVSAGGASGIDFLALTFYRVRSYTRVVRYSLEHKAKNHEKILSMAARSFREHGGDSSGIGTVMKKVGLAKGGFYRHFGSKDDLFVEAVARAFDEMGTGMLEVAKSAPQPCWGTRAETSPVFLPASDQAHTAIAAHDTPLATPQSVFVPTMAFGRALARGRRSHNPFLASSRGVCSDSVR